LDHSGAAVGFPKAVMLDSSSHSRVLIRFQMHQDFRLKILHNAGVSNPGDC
jgi:hypothetical protein